MQNLLVLFGGQSSEHEVSCMSAVNVIDCIDRKKYEVIPVGITKEGAWLFTDRVEDIRNGSWVNGIVSAVLSPDAKKQCLYLMDRNGTREIKIDVIFPVLHGLYGEDGTVQGLFELSRIPYVGCGVLASAASMDKATTKIIVDTLGIRQAEFVLITRAETKDLDACVKKVSEKIDYPVFVKPSSAGSSVGVSRADNAEMLKEALVLASKHDKKILVEEMIVGREVECAVFGGETTEASGVGEILAGAEFYDYDAKYNCPDSQTITNPEFPEGIEDEIRQDAIRIFEALGCHSLSRVDFFLDKKGVVFNEINTLPGFTSISMYPMLWEVKGVSKTELVEKLIETAFKREEH